MSRGTPASTGLTGFDLEDSGDLMLRSNVDTLALLISLFRMLREGAPDD